MSVVVWLSVAALFLTGIGGTWWWTQRRPVRVNLRRQVEDPSLYDRVEGLRKAGER